jgi:hypothetical protein
MKYFVGILREDGAWE